MADVQFVNFAFPATGGTANRTTPDRLAEIKNVVDFGADPGGGNVAATTAAIQAAVNWTSDANRGVIYFPLGHYQVNAPITYNGDNLSICFRGEQGANIFGNVSGYMFDRHSTTAAVTITIASPGVFTESAAHGLSVNNPIRFVKQNINGLLPTPLVAQATYYVKTVPSSTTYTVSATAGGTAINTSGSQSGVFIRGPVNTGTVIFEHLNIQNGNALNGTIRLGSTASGAVRDCNMNAFICVTTEDSAGVSSRNINFEDCVMAANSGAAGTHYIITGGGGSIQGCTLSGADTGVRAYGAGLSISGQRSERCNISYLFGLDSAGNNAGMYGLALFGLSTEGCWTAYDLAGRCDGFIMAGISALGHDSGNSGVVSGIKGSEYGLRIRADCARNGIIQSCTMGGDFQSQAGLAVEDATSRANVVIRETTGISNNGGGVGWITPTNAYTARFINNNVSPVYTFAGLPTGGNVLEGDEFDISDSTTATWGANVTTGGGSNRVRVRYNGTNWTVVGK